MQWPERGSRIADLRIERELGRGAFSRVYLALDELIGRSVALKVLVDFGGDAESERQRILAEARTVGRLQSPHIVTLYRVHPPEAGRPWMFEFEYVDGGSLDVHLAQGAPLGADAARPIALGIARALRTAHADGVLHGDVKPGNVLLAGDDVAKLADFGLARVLGDLGLRLSTRSDLAGTPIYMAPEVLMGEGAGTWSDVWSFGVLCYRMLSGRMPFGSPTLHGLVYAIENREPDPLPAAVPPPLARFVQHCLTKRPEGRPADGAALVAFLEGRAKVPAPAPEPGRARARRARLRGRAAELERLHARLQEAQDERRGGVVLVSGEGGVGKTALVHAAGAHVRQRGLVWIESQVTGLQGLLAPLLRGVEEGLRRAPPGVLAEETHADLEALVADPVSARGTVEGTLPGLRSVLAQVVDRSTVVLLLEDLHEATDEDLAVVTDLAERFGPRGLLVLATARTPGAEARAPLPPRLHAFASQSCVEHLPLGRLAAEDLFALLEDQLHGLRLDPEIARRIHRETGGNPLFACDLLRHMEESRCVVRDDAAVRRGPSWEEATLPRRFHDLVAARLVHLSEEDRGLLDVAAVAGPRFDGADVAAVAGMPVLKVLRRLQDICRRGGLVEPRERGYRFASPLIQEVIYRDLAPDLARLLHRSLAERLDGAGEADPEAVAAHWERAGEPDRARPHLLRAARRARDRQEGQRATRLAARAGLDLHHLGIEDVQEHADLILGLTSFDCNRERAPDVLDTVRAVAEREGDQALARRAAVRRADVDYRRDGAGAIDTAALIDADANLHDCFERARAAVLLSLVTKFAGDLSTSEIHLARAEDHADAIGHLGLQSTVRDLQGSLALRSGKLATAESLYRVAAELSRRAGRRSNAAVSTVNALLAAFSRGALEGVAEELESAIRTLDLEGSAVAAAHARLLLSDVWYAGGDTPAAEAEVAKALVALEVERRVVAYETALLQRGRLSHVTGRLDAALDSLREAETVARRRKTLFIGAEAMAWHARVLLQLGRPGKALDLARRCSESTLRVDDTSVCGATAQVLAEGALEGLPIDRIESLPALLDKGGESAAAQIGRALLAAAGPWGTPGGSGDALHAAAGTMRRESPGARRAERDVAAHLLEAEALARDGDATASARHTEAGYRAARRLGHVWLELAFLARAADDDGRARFRARLEEVAAGCGAPEPAEAVRRARGSV